jgi:DMSO/TMAO reductase YedYZ heme-binding membrane subunit
LLIAVQVSSAMMRRLPQVWWRRIHVTSYALVLVVSWHAVLAGTDIGRGLYTVAAVVLSMAPILVIALRAAAPPLRGPRRGSKRPSQRGVERAATRAPGDPPAPDRRTAEVSA